MLKVCIVSNAPVSQNPRVVKEADALADAGFEVVVLFAQHVGWTRALDAEILLGRRWRGRRVRLDWGHPLGAMVRLSSGLRARLFRLIAAWSFDAGIAELAFSRLLLEQLVIAVWERAGLYIAHNPQTLPIVALAARVSGARYGFDAEDLHTGEYPAERADDPLNRLLAYLEAKYLPGSAYVTAASEGIGQALSERYEIPLPRSVVNTFPWSDRAEIDHLRRDRAAGSSALSLYWYSQVVSLNRGLELILEAVGRVGPGVEVHIRGHLSPAVAAELEAIAARGGIDGQVVYHHTVSPSELLSRAAEHDVGLCLELPWTLNRDLSVTNKLFLYLLAGLAIVATRTRGQISVLGQCPDAAFLVEPDDVDALAAVITRLRDDRGLLERTQSAALRAAAERWQWEHDRPGLVDAVSMACQGPVR